MYVIFFSLGISWKSYFTIKVCLSSNARSKDVVFLIWFFNANLGKLDIFCRSSDHMYNCFKLYKLSYLAHLLLKENKSGLKQIICQKRSSSMINYHKLISRFLFHDTRMQTNLYRDSISVHHMPYAVISHMNIPCRHMAISMVILIRQFFGFLDAASF